MGIVIIRNDGKYKAWVEAFKKVDPKIPVFTPENLDHPDSIEMVMTWKAPKGSFQKFRNLKVIGSLGAGVDHLFDDPSLPKDVILTRVVDEKLSGDMQEFVLALCLSHLKNLNSYARGKGKWEPLSYQRVENVTVGILGFGTLGQAVGRLLHQVGFQVIGWSNSKKDVAGITSYSKEQLEPFLAQSQILVCLLPLTPKTKGVLNQQLFMKLPKGAYVINVARGGHLVDADLLSALDQGHLAGAALDVFHQEPLPADHKFWERDHILITPHVASVSNPSTVVPQIIENYKRLKNGQELKNTVSRDAQY